MLAVLALGLGLGANAALFSLVEASLLRPLPFAAAERVVRIWEVTREDAQASGTLSPGDIRSLARTSRTFEALAGYRSSSFNLETGQEPERVPGAVVTPNFFRVFRVQPAAGRLMDDARADGVREAVLSERFWRSRLGADPSAVGRTLELGGELVTVVGVAPAAFEVPAGTEIWVAGKSWVPENPLRPWEDVSTNRASHYLFAAGRLRPGGSVKAAADELNALARSIAPDDPDLRFRTVEYRDDLVGPVRPRLLLLLGAVGLVLLLACANVAALLLAQALRQRHEVAVRVALGASWRELLRIQLLRGALLSAGGAALGLLLAAFTPPLLVGLGVAGLHRGDLRLSPAVLAVTAALAIGSTLLVSALPVLATGTAAGDLRGAPASAPPRTARLRGLLVMVEVALAFVLLVSAGLLIRSVARLEGVDPGFRSARVAAGSIALPTSRYGTVASQRAFLDRLGAALAARPEIESHAFASHLPLGVGNVQRTFRIPGLDEPLDVDMRLVSPGYFGTLGIPLLSGRGLEPADRDAPVVIVNAQFVRRFMPGGDAVGRTVFRGDQELRVVGIVADVVQTRLDRPPHPEIYFPIGSESWPTMSVVVRSRGTVDVASTALRAALREVDGRQALSRFGPVEDLVRSSVSDRRQSMELLALLGVLAVILAATGIYGVLVENVSQRTRELGIRLALGATARRVLTLVVAGSMKQVIAGLVVGVVAARLAATGLSGALFGVGAADPWTYGTALAGLMLVALCAAALGARRATSVQPSVALQEE